MDSLTLQMQGAAYNMESAYNGGADSGQGGGGVSVGLTPFNRSLTEAQQTINGGIEGRMYLTAISPLQETKVNSMATYCSQADAQGRGRLVMYTKPLGSTTFTLLAQTEQITFDTVTLYTAALEGGEITIPALTQVYMGVVALNQPYFLRYRGYQSNSPYQISHTLGNVWTQPVSDPVPSAPASFTGGSESADRFWVAAFLA
ncbi:MAG: hypothetical protein R3356_02310 [Eudoraea sp.]|nr:hypothetical protein [Eudoraea sp.]